MKKLTTLFASLILLAVAPAQKKDDYTVKLRSAADVVLAGKKAELIMTIDVKSKSTLPAILLNGYEFATTVDGKRGPKIIERASGKVTLAGGIKIERHIAVSLDRIAPNLKKNAVTRLALEWVGMKGVSAVIDVAPDLSSVSVDQLDLEKTRVLLVTNYGNMLVRFHPDRAPNTVKNFIKLSKSGFYDGTRFHRVVRNFMIQGGCPNTKKGATGRPGTGSPGYSIKAEFNATRHVKGVLSMARSSSPDSAGCQFFIVHGTSPHLDGSYTAFGELVSGEGTLDKIANIPVKGETPTEMIHLKAAIVQPVMKK